MEIGTMFVNLIFYVGMPFLALAACGILFALWLTERRYKGSMVAAVWGADGFEKRSLVKVDEVSMTVEVKGCTYMLPRERAEIEGGEDSTQEPGHPKYPTKRFVRWPLLVIFGWSPFYISLRLEGWQEGNPEPIRPFYGMFADKNGKPCDPMAEGAIFSSSQLIVTASQLRTYRNVIQAVSIAKKIQETEARWKTFERALANIPSKMLTYILLIIAAGGSFVTILLLLKNMSGGG